jgi:hypothetical protein
LALVQSSYFKILQQAINQKLTFKVLIAALLFGCLNLGSNKEPFELPPILIKGLPINAGVKAFYLQRTMLTSGNYFIT